MPASWIRAAALLALLNWPHVAPSEAAERPNIVVIMGDDMGYSDIGCYGGEIKTPVLDGLAENGVRFTQFYNMARCCPTRASLLTGLYPHQAGIGHMTDDRQLIGYQGDLNDECLTMAQVLKTAGYGTYMSGKWHVTKHANGVKDSARKSNWPLQRGFDRFYGTIIGAGSFYDPNTLVRGNDYITPENDRLYRPDVYYYTDAISDNAVRFVADHHARSQAEPLFMYVSYTAAHWPMHALPEDIARYHGAYNKGYGPIRAARYQRMQKLGLLAPDWGMSPQAGDWSQVEHKQWEARCMEVYAAMVDNMDRGIGRIVDELRRTGRLDNTLILYLQDNGGCAEGMGRSPQADANWVANTKNVRPMKPDELQPQLWPPMQTRDGRVVRGGPQVMPGPADTYIAYGRAWANVSNTPFREYKHWVHEGGISTPLIAHWPSGITGDLGRLENAPGHLIDIMATCVDLAGATYPKTWQDKPLIPLQGISLRPALEGKSLERGRPLFWEHEGNRAMRDGRWKLVAKGAQSPWELYDIQADRSELNNLAAKHPDRVKQMAAAWTDWAGEARVLPWPWDPRPRRTSRQTRFELKPGDERTGGQAPDTGRRGFRIRADIARSGPGVIVAQGGVAHGFSLYLDKQLRPAFDLRRNGRLETVKAEQPLSRPATVHCQLDQDGRIRLLRGDTLLVEETLSGVLTQTPQDGLAVGSDTNDPVGEYPRTNRFQGEIKSVVLELLPQ